MAFLQPRTAQAPAPVAAVFPILQNIQTERAAEAGQATKRRGHRKSRNGCITCKKRRVKCQETLPECGNCTRLGLRCTYVKEPTPPAPSPALPSTPVEFTRDDLRFFHHFLMTAYPPLPIRGDTVWQQMAQLSHEYDYLSHAMLGLAASHLALSNGGDYASTALAHRVRAINTFNTALSNPCTSHADGDARFATIMILTFQASYMPEGMQELLSTVRGCIIVSWGTMLTYGESAFRSFTSDQHRLSAQAMEQRRASIIPDDEVVSRALESVKALRSLCKSVMEVEYIAAIEGILNIARTSYAEAFGQIGRCYAILGEASTADFDNFNNTSNHTSQLIMAHFFAIDYEVSEVALQSVEKSFPFRQKIVATWVGEIAARLPPTHLEYIAWPLEFVGTVRSASVSS